MSCSHTSKHLHENAMQSPFQHGFRKKHYYEMHLLLTTLTIYTTKICEVDIEPHQRLISKLECYDINGNVQKHFYMFRWLFARCSITTLILIEGATKKYLRYILSNDLTWYTYGWSGRESKPETRLHTSQSSNVKALRILPFTSDARICIF